MQREIQHIGGDDYDDLQIWLDMTSHENPPKQTHAHVNNLYATFTHVQALQEVLGVNK